MSTDVRFIAYIDALHISDKNIADEDSFAIALSNFHQIVRNSAYHLNAEGRVHYFHDCAYIESPTSENLIAFLQSVRIKLLGVNIYLRGSIAKGALGSSAFSNGDTKVTGVYFGTRDLFPLYKLQSELKGIGIRISDDCKRDFSGETVVSCFVPDTYKNEVECFLDLKFQTEDLENGYYDLFLEDFLVSTAKSKRIGRYYIPLMITWIRSLSFNHLRDFDSTTGRMYVDENSKQVSDNEIPKVIRDILLSRYTQHFANLYGIDYVYFVLLDKVLSEINDNRLRKRMFDFIWHKRRLVTRMQNTPTRILSERNKHIFFNMLRTPVKEREKLTS